MEWSKCLYWIWFDLWIFLQMHLSTLLTLMLWYNVLHCIAPNRTEQNWIETNTSSLCRSHSLSVCTAAALTLSGFTQRKICVRLREQNSRYMRVYSTQIMLCALLPSNSTSVRTSPYLFYVCLLSKQCSNSNMFTRCDSLGVYDPICVDIQHQTIPIPLKSRYINSYGTFDWLSVWRYMLAFTTISRHTERAELQTWQTYYGVCGACGSSYVSFCSCLRLCL